MVEDEASLIGSSIHCVVKQLFVQVVLRLGSVREDLLQVIAEGKASWR